MEAYQDGNLRVEFVMDSRTGVNGEERKIVAIFTGLKPGELTDINMQVAVQKNVKMVQLNTASGTMISGPTNGLSQEMRVVNTLDGTKAIAMKVKITYRFSGQLITDTKLVSFPLNA